MFVLLAAAVGLAALGALFALLAWRRSIGSGDAARAQIAVLANELQHTERAIREETARMREEAEHRGVHLRGEVRDQIGAVGGRLAEGLEGTRGAVETRLDRFASQQAELAEKLRFEVGLGDGLGEGLKTDMTAFQTATREAMTAVEARIGALTEANAQRQNALREAIEQRLEALRAANDAKLEQMRATRKSSRARWRSGSASPLRRWSASAWRTCSAALARCRPWRSASAI